MLSLWFRRVRNHKRGHTHKEDKMTYCSLHRRVLYPGGYDPRAKKRKKSHWYQMRTEVFRAGFVVASAFPRVKLTEQPCDKCVAERGMELFM